MTANDPAEPRPLRDRQEAGERLAALLRPRVDRTAVVVAIPRGGVPVGAVIAASLGLPLDVLVVRKVGAPGNPEYGLGAVAEGGFRFLDRERASEAGAADDDLAPIVRAGEAEVAWRAARYREGRAPFDVRGRTVVLVDDGVATGGTVVAAARTLAGRGAGRVIVALGVAPADTVRRLQREAREVVVAITPRVFYAVSEWYREFPQVEDAEVLATLRRAAEARRDPP